MKASLRFRDEQKPLVRAKIPVSILGLPFLSGVSAGDDAELRLDLGTAFESGPSLRLSYRPNDPWNPFTLAVKTGIGPLGSPASAAAMTMCAEFGLVGRGGPRFTIHVKPRLGDFCLRKSTSSTGAGSPPPFAPGAAVVVVGGHETGGEDPVDGAGFLPHGGTFAGNKPNGISTGNPGGGSGGIRGLLSGAELTARSILPLRNRAAVKFRWGVRVPSDLRPPFASSGHRLPLLVMSKVSVEHVPGEPAPNEKPADVAEACFSVQRQLAALQAEYGMLRRAVEELRADLGGRGPAASGGDSADKTPRSETLVYKAREGERDGARAAPLAKNGNNSAGRREVNEGGGAATKEDVNEELRKALMVAAAGGV